MKAIIIMLMAGIVSSQVGISAATSSEDSAASDLAAAGIRLPMFASKRTVAVLPS